MFPNIFLPLRRIMGDFIAVNIDKKERNFKSLSQEDIIWYSKDFINKSPVKVDTKSSNVKQKINVKDVYERGFEDNRRTPSISSDDALISMLIHLNLMLAKILKNSGDDKK